MFSFFYYFLLFFLFCDLYSLNSGSFLFGASHLLGREEMNFRPGLLSSHAGVLEPWAEKDWLTNIHHAGSSHCCQTHRGLGVSVKLPRGAFSTPVSCHPPYSSAWKLSKQLRKMKPACLGVCSSLILASYEISKLCNSLCLNLFVCKLGIQYLADWLWEENTGHALGIVIPHSHTSLKCKLPEDRNLCASVHCS